VRVSYTRRARGDLRRHAAFIRQHSPRGAARIGAAIRASINLLRDFPELGAPTSRDGVRRLSVPRTPFLVIYRLESARVSILKILHRARNERE
jgi:toxin ParE1/3/4